MGQSRMGGRNGGVPRPAAAPIREKQNAPKKNFGASGNAGGAQGAPLVRVDQALASAAASGAAAAGASAGAASAAGAGSPVLAAAFLPLADLRDFL